MKEIASVFAHTNNHNKWYIDDYWPAVSASLYFIMTNKCQRVIDFSNTNWDSLSEKLRYRNANRIDFGASEHDDVAIQSFQLPRQLG